MSKNILITGVAGFIGSNLLKALLERGDTVIGVDNFNNFYDPQIKVGNLSEYFSKEKLTTLVENIDSPLSDFQGIHPNFSSPEFKYPEQKIENVLESDDGKFKLYGVDLCDIKTLDKIFHNNKIDTIVHLAALAGVRPSTQKPLLYAYNNGQSTANLIELARRYEIKKYVFASSSSVYGARNQVPFVESEDISKPISPYAASKVSGEAMLHTFHYLTKIPCVALRFFTVYGAGQRPDLAIHKFAKLIADGKQIQIYGDGSAKRDFTFVEDILDGIIKSIDVECAFEIFNLGESDTTDVKTLVQLIEKALGVKANIEFADPIPGDVPITCADISKSKKLLGYNPQTKIEEGIPKFIEWFNSYYGNKVEVTK